MSDPTDYLTLPAEPDESFSNGFGSPLDFFNYVSPSAWIMEIVEELTGWDPLGEITSFLAGDWEAIAKFGEAMGNLSRFMQEFGIEIQQGMLTLDQLWDGNASDAAYMYFSNFASAVSRQQMPIFDSEHSYHQAAKGAWLFADQLGNIVQTMADTAIIAGMLMAGSTVAASTGVGAVVAIGGYAGSAIYVARLLRFVNDAAQIIQGAGLVILTAFGLTVDATSQVGRLSDVPLPAAGFSLPRATS
jgi:hypothetical protein